MINAKMMKKAAISNWDRYGTNEHIFGIGMATKENEEILAHMRKASSKDKNAEKRPKK